MNYAEWNISGTSRSQASPDSTRHSSAFGINRNVSTTMIQPGSKFKLGSSTLVDDLDEFRHSARRVLLAELETHQIQATH